MTDIADKDIWRVTAVRKNTDGSTTLTMQNLATGTIKIEDFPVGATVDRIVTNGNA